MNPSNEGLRVNLLVVPYPHKPLSWSDISEWNFRAQIRRENYHLFPPSIETFIVRGSDPDVLFCDESVKIFSLFQVLHKKYHVTVMGWPDFYQKLISSDLNEFSIIVLPPLEQRFLFPVDLLRSDSRDVFFLNEWKKSGKNRKVYPEVFQMVAEGHRSYYDILRDMNLDGMGFEVIPFIRVDSDLDDEILKQKITNFRNDQNSNGVFIQRTFSAEMAHIKHFSNEVVNDNMGAVMKWMREQSDYNSKSFMIEKFVDYHWSEYRIWAVNGKYFRGLIDMNADWDTWHIKELEDIFQGEEYIFMHNLLSTATENVVKILQKFPEYSHFGAVCRVDFFYSRGRPLILNEAQGLTSCALFSNWANSVEEYQAEFVNALEGYISKA
eukprot:TRINITY_DN3265_c0_g1_i4.p1 TRINITY_DN3265_c0_g1~~TRINITY_DN3265_c0_g1_i4.p1  ORF type:complete len:381 (+),score=50.38 TRINITY_DN3265_c0_g1_i4:146-1288(+)